MFSTLDPDEILVESKRKAQKKLKEIKKLLSKKGTLTQEEADKVATEKYWQRIVTPNKIDEIKTKKERKADLRAKTQAAKEKYEREKPTKAKTREREEEYSKQFQKRQDEYARQERKRNFEEMQSKPKPKPNLDYLFVLGEFNTLYHTYQNIDMVFRMLSRKYHPDKNIDRPEWATSMQQHLVNVKQHFQNITI